MSIIRKLALLLFGLSSLGIMSCNKQQEEISKELNQKIKSAISELSNNPSQPIEEIKKLSQLEYKTLVFPLEIDAETITSRLNTLGLDRWGCDGGFSRPRTAPTPPEMVIICKRTPETVLRFVPKSILGR